MRLPASTIALADPLCPSCAKPVAENDSVCPTCGFGFELAITLLPYRAPALRKFIDVDHRLSRSDIKRGHRATKRLHSRFPQVTVCTCVSEIPDGISITEFGFWLFNQSGASGSELSGRRLHSILLVIDPNHGEASLTVGYGLDPFIDDASLERCLARIKRELSAKNYGKAIEKLCGALLPVLERGHKLVGKAVDHHVSERKKLHRRRTQARPVESVVTADGVPNQPPANKIPPPRRNSHV